MPLFSSSSLNRISNILLNRVQDKNDSELVRKILLLYGTAIIGIVFLTILGGLAIYQKSILVGTLDLVAVVVLVTNLIFMYFSTRYTLLCYIGVTVILFLFFFLFITGGVHNTGFMWLYTYPLISLFLLGAKFGTVYNLLLFVPSVAFLCFNLYSGDSQIYNSTFVMRFIPSYLAVFTLSYIYEKLRETTQQKLENAHEKQERIIEQRTEQLKHEIARREEYSEKLRHSQKMEAIGLMASGVAHDLNNILSGIVSYPELLLYKLPENSDLRRPLETIRESGKRSAAVVSDLLTVARGVASPKEIRNMNDFVQDYMESPEFRKLKKSNKNIVFSTDLDSSVSNFLCSSIHIKKCIMNLVINAAEAINDDGAVTISTYEETISSDFAQRHNVEENTYVVLSITDTGEGISAKDMEHIFEPFYSKKIMGRSGTGLGLAVVWNTVHDHNGAIVLDSNKNGTRFDLYFPITHETIPHTDESFRIEDLSGNGETILVVDDEFMQLEIASGMLVSLGYKPVTVPSGEEAVKYLSTHTTDIVLLDMIMGPGMNGCETYEKIVKLHPGQKALIASGFSQNDDVEKAMKLGVKGFLKKPYSLEQLGKSIQQHLKE